MFNKLVFSLLFLLGGCTLFKKTISKPVIIRVENVGNPLSINYSASYIKYLDGLNENDLFEAFMKGFMSEAAITQNVTVDNASSSPDYIVRITKVVVTESEFSETIKDSESEFNGQVFYLNKVECSAELDCINAKTNKKIGSTCFSSRERSEKIKNNRTAVDFVSGTNKDKNVYRQKALGENVANNITETAGRRIWVPLTKRIKKNVTN